MGRDAQEAEFSTYFAAGFDRTRRTAYLLCGDWHRADDLAQLAFVRLASSWHRLRDKGAIDAYVRTCLMRAFLSDQRRAWRRREAATADLPEPPGRVGRAAPGAPRGAGVAARAPGPPRPPGGGGGRRPRGGGGGGGRPPRPTCRNRPAGSTAPNRLPTG